MQYDSRGRLTTTTMPRFLPASLRYAVLGGTTAATAGFAYRYQQVLRRERELPDQPLPVFTTADANRKNERKPQEQQRVIVVGAGVVGVATAYKLAKAGHAVTVLEPASQPATECSKCAAGGMQRANVVVDQDTWIAVTKCLLAPVASLFGRSKNDDNFTFFHMSWTKTLSDPFFLRWLYAFTTTSFFPDKEQQQQKQDEMLKFTKFAVDDMVQMMHDKYDNMAKTSGYNNNGSVSVSYDPIVVAEETTKSDSKPTVADHPSGKNSYEPFRKLVGEEMMEQEPSLRLQEMEPTAAKYEYEAKSASSERFTKELATRCEKDPSLDVTFLYDCSVKAITVAGAQESSSNKPRISQLKTNRGVIAVPADVKVVVAAGSWTPHILSLGNLYAPVYPLKGYAMSVSANEALKTNPALKPQDLPSRIVSDKYMYTSRLGDEIRITSIGEFSGWGTQPTVDVDAEFRREANRRYPQLQPLMDQAVTYCGLRPYVSDGILLLGAVDTHENLFVTCGPGSNGWKLAMGSGEIMERLVSGQTPEQINAELGFDVDAFSPAGRVVHAPFFAKICRARWDV